MRNKLLKKIGAIALAAAMMMGLATSANAYVDVNDTTTKGSITVHKFLSNTEGKIPGDGNEITDTSGFGTPASGVKFCLTKVELENNDYTGNISPEYEMGEIKYDDETVRKVMYMNLERTNGETEKVYVGSFSEANAVVQTTDGEGKCTFNNLERGYYVLEELSILPTHTPHSLPSLIAVPLTKADGSGHNWDIHVYPKNVRDDMITKTLDEENALVQPGKEFSWTIKATIEDYTELRKGTEGSYKYGYFAVRDYPSSEKLEFVSSKVMVGTTELSGSGDTPDYTYTPAVFENGILRFPAKWELTPAGIDKLIQAKATEMTVTVTTKFNSYTTTGAVVGIRNKADFVKDPAEENQTENQKPDPDPTPNPNPKPDPNDPEHPVTPDVTAPKANIAIEKFLSQAAIDQNAAENNENKKITLDGIEFWLAKVPNPKTSGDGWQNDFVLDAENNEPIVAITDTNGNAVFEGVPYDEEDGNDYYIIEVKTKPGLQLKDNSIKVHLAENMTGTEDGVVKDYTVTAEITNYLTTEKDPDGPIFELPMTGGIGTTLFILIGAAIVGLGVLMVVKSKKKTA